MVSNTSVPQNPGDARTLLQSGQHASLNHPRRRPLREAHKPRRRVLHAAVMDAAVLHAAVMEQPTGGPIGRFPEGKTTTDGLTDRHGDGSCAEAENLESRDLGADGLRISVLKRKTSKTGTSADAPNYEITEGPPEPSPNYESRRITPR